MKVFMIACALWGYLFQAGENQQFDAPCCEIENASYDEYDCFLRKHQDSFDNLNKLTTWSPFNRKSSLEVANPTAEDYVIDSVRNMMGELKEISDVMEHHAKQEERARQRMAKMDRQEIVDVGACCLVGKLPSQGRQGLFHQLDVKEYAQARNRTSRKGSTDTFIRQKFEQCLRLPIGKTSKETQSALQSECGRYKEELERYLKGRVEETRVK